MSDPNQFDPKKFGEDLRDRIHNDINIHIRGRRFRSRSNSMLPGMVLVIIGAVILLDHMGIISVDHLWRFWPAILIFAGAVRFAEACNRAVSVMLMAVGAILLLGNLGYLHLSWADMWPIILIAIGVTMIWGRMTMPSIPSNSTGTTSTSVVNATALFGGVERRITSTNFTSGTISSTFGGVELDFRSADIEGEEAVLYMEATFGGVEIVIPERWMAIYEGFSMFGGYNDETRPPLQEVPGAPPKKRLIIRGHAIFGGITVKN